MMPPFQTLCTATRRMSLSSLSSSLLSLSLLASSSVVVVAQKAAAAAGVGGGSDVAVQPPPPPILQTRDTFVPYPATALTMLLEEVEDIGAPLGLEVVTSMAPPNNPADSSYEVWQLLKGMVHRFRNQNQIIHANPHYYITNGFDLGCRAIQVDVDTNRQVELQVKPIPPQCHGACTNHGRYCVVSNEADPESDNSKGAMLVEETLRRLCFVEIYHGSDLRFWEYMEAFERLQCGAVTGGTLMSSCAERAVKQVPRIEYAPLENCMHLAGGLKDDVINVRLKEEMDKQVKGRFPYTMKDLPLIRVAAQKFSGPRNVPSIFRFACSVYQEKTGISPIACDFCADCLGVKQCLWELTCNGVPFDTTTFQQQQQQLLYSPTSAPSTTDSGVGVIPSGQNATTLTSPPPPSPFPTTTPNTLINSTSSPTSGTTTTSQPTASPSQLEEPEFVPFQHQTLEPSPSVPPPSTTTTNSSAASSESSALTEEGSFNDDEYDNSDDKDYYHSPFVVYGVPVLVAVGLLVIYAIVSRCIRHHHDQHKMSSAEEYVNDLMNESYRDNMAVSGRIEDEASDRSMEDVSIEEHNFGAPPFASFKVHMVMA